MVTWTSKDECDLLEALIAVSKGVVAKGLYKELSKKMNKRFSAEAIRQKIINIRRKGNGGSAGPANEKITGKSSPTISKRRSPMKKKKRSPKWGKSPDSDITPSPDPTGEEIGTPSRSRPARRVSKKVYTIESDVDVSEDDTREGTLMVKTAKVDSGAELSDQTEHEEDEMEFRCEDAE